MRKTAWVLVCAGVLGFLVLNCISSPAGSIVTRPGITAAPQGGAAGAEGATMAAPQGGAAGAEGATIAAPQFKADEIADFAKWDDFLATAKIVKQERLPMSEGVTQPWKLTLEKDGVTRNAVWKGLAGIIKGYKESWETEIAAYRLSKALGLNMVPPTVEREFQGKKGSIQLWVDYWKNFEAITKDKLQPQGIRYTYFIREICLQRAFDNLISNEDRHQRNYLITEDWRLILIDHSRTFRTTSKFTKGLIYDENFKEGKNFIMDSLPRKFYEAIKGLTAASIREIVGNTLTDEEISATMARQALMVAWIEKHIKEKGETYVLYD